jgi:hypothetical protein
MPRTVKATATSRATSVPIPPIPTISRIASVREASTRAISASSSCSFALTIRSTALFSPCRVVRLASSSPIWLAAAGLLARRLDHLAPQLHKARELLAHVGELPVPLHRHQPLDRGPMLLDPRQRRQQRPGELLRLSPSWRTCRCRAISMTAALISPLIRSPVSARSDTTSMSCTWRP